MVEVLVRLTDTLKERIDKHGIDINEVAVESVQEKVWEIEDRELGEAIRRLKKNLGDKPSPEDIITAVRETEDGQLILDSEVFKS